MMEVFIWGEPW